MSCLMTLRRGSRRGDSNPRPLHYERDSSAAAVVWVTALSALALALARSSQARPGHSLFVRGDCPLGEARHAELVRGGARLVDELAALG
jgi:hypothetical protein